MRRGEGRAGETRWCLVEGGGGGEEMRGIHWYP